MYFNPNSIEDQDKKIVQSCFIYGISSENIKSIIFTKNYFLIRIIKQ